MPTTHAQREAGWKAAFAWFLALFLLLFAYAFFRYVILRGVPLDSVPLYLTNKVFATVAVALIGMSFALGPLCRVSRRFISRLFLRKYLGVFGFGVAAVHGVISLLLFTPAYYPRLFAEGGKLTLTGELSLLFGVLAAFIFAAVSVTSIPSVEKGMHPDQWQFVQRLGYLAFFLTLLHVGVMGYGGWLNASAWAGGPPITLIAAAIILAVFALRGGALVSAKKR